MNVESLREYCLSLPFVTEGFPFGEETLVFKVNEKMFALLNLTGDLSINLKCNPELAIELRESFSCVLPGYHMNKMHWNTVLIDGSIGDLKIKEWIDHSYWAVVASLNKKERTQIVLKTEKL